MNAHEHSEIGRAAGRTHPLRVVIAEDEALIRLDLAEMLAEEGIDVVGEADHGDRAVDLATMLRPDLVILDVRLPTRDGVAAAAEIVAEQIAPVVILTAFSPRSLPESAARARDMGATAYVVKPFSKEDLLPAIELAVARHAETAALRLEITDLNQRLHARTVIEQAKGTLMVQRAMTEPEAFRWIQQTAKNNRTTMVQIAGELLADAIWPAAG